MIIGSNSARMMNSSITRAVNPMTASKIISASGQTRSATVGSTNVQRRQPVATGPARASTSTVMRPPPAPLPISGPASRTASSYISGSRIEPLKPNKPPRRTITVSGPGGKVLPGPAVGIMYGQETTALGPGTYVHTDNGYTVYFRNCPTWKDKQELNNPSRPLSPRSAGSYGKALLHILGEDQQRTNKRDVENTQSLDKRKEGNAASSSIITSQSSGNLYGKSTTVPNAPILNAPRPNGNVPLVRPSVTFTAGATAVPTIQSKMGSKNPPSKVNGVGEEKPDGSSTTYPSLVVNSKPCLQEKPSKADLTAARAELG